MAMRKISDIISKPSEALQEMLNGLNESKTWKNFELDMDTYGEVSRGVTICFGCAATCTVYAIAKKQAITRGISNFTSKKPNQYANQSQILNSGCINSCYGIKHRMQSQQKNDRQGVHQEGTEVQQLRSLEKKKRD
jgi:hypothetical protein